MDNWSEQFVAERAVILHVERMSWRRHEEFYTQHMLGMCLRMKWARETWVRRMFQFLCDQFCVNTAVDLAEILNTCMTKNDSIACIGFNLKVKRAYYGIYNYYYGP